MSFVASCHSPAGHERASCAAHRRSFARALPLCGVLLLLARCPLALASDGFRLPIQYTHTKWNDSPGLKGRVNSMVQTSDGYLWLGTEFGLVRFDGIRFIPSGPGVGPLYRAPLSGLCWLRAMAACGLARWTGSSVGIRASLCDTQSSRHSLSSRCWRTTREPCGREALRGSARFVAKKFSAVRSKVAPATVCIIQMRIAAVSFIPCMRTANGICGPEPRRDCGSGRPALRTATPRRSFARPRLWLLGIEGRG